jgi:transposase
MSNHKQRKRIKKRISKHLEQVNLFAAGIDIGSQSHYVSVPAELDSEPVREFPCFTGDLNRMADWLVKVGIKTVAMESTGVYWIPAFEILEERGLEVLLVNARHVKNVPGRKSDVQDCQWLQQLHTYGLLRGAFRPDEEVVALRTYMRQRDMLIHRAADHIRHMQKALRLMNLLLDNVVSDIKGVTGMQIIRAILSGERDPLALAKFRDGRCKKSEKVIASSLVGHYRDEHLFSLKQAVELYDTYQQQIDSCDAAIEAQLERMGSGNDRGDIPPTKKKKTKSSPNFDVRGDIYRMTGVDLTQIDGLNEASVLKIISETGIDVSPWPTVKHFSSWLGLSPGNKITGGKILSSKTKPSANRAAEAFRVAAFGMFNSKSALGAYCRRQRARLGAPKAITATAHKIARTFYSMLKNGSEYVDQGQDYYEQQYRDRITRNLKKRAADMGFDLVPKEETKEALRLASAVG